MHPSPRFVPVLLLCFCLAMGTGQPAQDKSRDPIRVGISDRTSQQVIAHIAGRALAMAGFKVEFVRMDGESVTLLSSGAIHFDPDVVVADPGVTQALADEKVFSLGGLQSNAMDAPSLKLMWPGVHNNWPYAERMLKTMIFPAEDLDQLAGSIEGGEQTLDQAVASWMKSNTSTWKRWISGSKNWMKP